MILIVVGGGGEEKMHSLSFIKDFVVRFNDLLTQTQKITTHK